MNSLRELTRSTHKPCSLRQWATDRKIAFPFSLLAVMSAYAPPKLWGFADLHAHPASHLAFGATPQGTNGPFYGNPSCLPVETASQTIATDLAPCDGFAHSFFGPHLDPSKTDLDLVRRTQRLIIRFGIENSDFSPHDLHGWPQCISWPSASSVSHQQMHISCIHRAWQGGLRLMIASVTDNQLMARLWNRGAGSDYPEPDPNFDFQSARRQLQFIHAQVLANSTWMQIVTTPAEAQMAISKGKLVIILGVEMDTLTVDQIIALKNEFGICQVVPIHLTNNVFGGVAVYEDLFNTNNWYLQGGKCLSLADNHAIDLFFSVEDAPNLTFRLGKPQILIPITGDTPLGPVGPILPPGVPVQPGIIIPWDVTDEEHAMIGYEENKQSGHRNILGLANHLDIANHLDLAKPELLKLMKAGFIIDLAHMSEKSQTDALNLGESYGYPFVDTHTAMRPDERKDKTSERDIPKSLVEKLSKNGGVIGFGTTGYRDPLTKQPVGDQLAQWIEDYWGMWNAMKFHGVAIGTDTNGLSPQIPGSSRQFNYEDAGLAKSKIGIKEFDFAVAGLAHYGMLADFIHALRQFDTGADIADHFLFHTAEDTIEMWEKVEQAATKIP